MLETEDRRFSKTIKSQRDCTVGTALALHVANLSPIPELIRSVLSTEPVGDPGYYQASTPFKKKNPMGLFYNISSVLYKCYILLID